jgi:hypothetical protein
VVSGGVEFDVVVGIGGPELVAIAGLGGIVGEAQIDVGSASASASTSPMSVFWA